MKKVVLKTALLLFVGLASTAQAWDFDFGYTHAFHPNATNYVVEQSNIERSAEGDASHGVSYWHPIQNGVEARLTQKFSFPRQTDRIRMFAHMASYNFSASTYGSGTVHGSKDGTNWVLLMESPRPAGIDGGAFFNADLPASLVGGKEIWIQARMQTEGWAIMAQYLRADTSASPNPINVFDIKVNLKPELSIETAAVRLRWFGESNVTYQVQSSVNHADWSNHVAIVGSGIETNRLEWVEGERRFYRIVRE